MASTRGKKLGKKRGGAWNDEETKCLLEIWEENCIEEQLENPKANNGSVYKTVSTQMLERGFNRTSDQCKIRIHTLKRSYRECKTNMKKSGKGRKVCKFYEDLDRILGNRPASSPVKVIETLNKKNTNDDMSEVSEDDGELSVLAADGFVDIAPLDDRDDESKQGPVEEQTVDPDKTDASADLNVKNPPDAKKRRESSGDDVVRSKIKEKRVRKSKFEQAISTVMDKFSSENEKAEDKILDIERNKIDLEKQRLDLEKAKMDSEERQRREEREHQFNMMRMIMGAVRGYDGPPSFAVNSGRQHFGEESYRGQGLSASSTPGRGLSSGASMGSESVDGPTYLNL